MILNYLAIRTVILLLYEDNFEHLAFLSTILLLYEDNLELFKPSYLPFCSGIKMILNYLVFLPAILLLCEDNFVIFSLPTCHLAVVSCQ